MGNGQITRLAFGDRQNGRTHWENIKFTGKRIPITARRYIILPGELMEVIPLQDPLVQQKLRRPIGPLKPQ